MAGRPLWRRTFDTVERSVAKRLERGVETAGFTSAIGVAAKAQRLVKGAIEETSTRILHALNLPTYRDVKQEARRMSRIEHRLRELDRTVSQDRDRGRDEG
jgi:hypothetical protein